MYGYDYIIFQNLKNKYKFDYFKLLKFTLTKSFDLFI